MGVILCDMTDWDENEAPDKASGRMYLQRQVKDILHVTCCIPTHINSLHQFLWEDKIQEDGYVL